MAPELKVFCAIGQQPNYPKMNDSKWISAATELIKIHTPGFYVQIAAWRFYKSEMKF